MRTLTILVLAMLASACSTPTPDGETTAATKILAPEMLVPGSSTTALMVKRDRGGGGFSGTCLHRISLDGRAVAELRPGEAVTIFAAPGDHILGASTPATLCPGGVIEASVRLEPGRRPTFRTGRPTGGDLMLMPTTY